MGKIPFAFITSIVLLLFGIFIYYNSDVETFRFNKKVDLFDMSDPIGDDHGPGAYKYPIDPAFEPGKGIFDLTKFEVDAYRDQYIFDISFAEMRDPLGSPGGFIQLVQIYIADGSGEGMTNPERPGANITLDPKNPWKYLIKVTSWQDSGVFYSNQGEEQDGIKEGIKAQLIPGTKTVRVTLLKSLLPGKYKNWKYYVLVGSQDGNGPDRFRQVNKKVDEWEFSGSNGSKYEPNVIDILAPTKGEQTQEKMLSSFNIKRNKYAIIYPVGK